MITCSKLFSDIPFAHRQHLHEGHCRFIHGHNWSIQLTFACKELDKHGFVVDFGDLNYIRSWFDENLDHACVFSQSDPLREEIVGSAPKGIYKVYVVENSSCEGIAAHLYEVLNSLVTMHTDGRAWISEIQLWEDRKNSVIFKP